MAYLRKQDYFTTIREQDFDVILDNLTEVTAYSSDYVLQDAEKKAIAKISSMICHRYDVGLIFKDILTWNDTTQYNIGELVQYGETAYSETSTYSVNDLVSYQETVNGTLTDKIYQCSIAVTQPEKFNKAKWTETVNNNELYVVREPVTATKPGTEFVYTANSYTGNHDTIKGWNTTNDIFLKRDGESVKIYYSAADRTNDSNSIGVVNVGTQVKEFPASIEIQSGDDSENTLSGYLEIIGFMPDGTEWDVVATNPFQKEDNRNRLIISILIDLVLFDLHGRINYRNIPDFRGDAKEDAMEMLNDIKKGIIKPDLPLYNDDTKGHRIVYGSETKLNQNFFS